MQIPSEILKSFETMRAAVHHGVYWDGSYENISGVTKEEALDTASDFITTFEKWLEELAPVEKTNVRRP